jgi:hypothetical protein
MLGAYRSASEGVGAPAMVPLDEFYIAHHRPNLAMSVLGGAR